MTEREKMLSGLLYDPSDPELSRQRDVARNMAAAFNRTTEEEKLKRQEILKALLGSIGGNAVILPGVTIGSDTVIGAGSVVTRDIPAGVLAVGNPCRVLREISERDKME